MEKERQIQIKSNLAKAENGWGAGYNSQDGRSVVGAAHGIDEMIRMAKINVKTSQSTFRDETNGDNTPSESTIKAQEELRILEELKAEAEAAANGGMSSTGTGGTTGDLLGSFNPNPSPAVPHSSSSTPQVDLLDFGTTTTTTTITNSTGYPSNQGDLLGGLATSTMSSSQQASLDPFSSGPRNPTADNSSGCFGGNMMMMPSSHLSGGPSVQSMQMGVTTDPFSSQTVTQPIQQSVMSCNINGLTTNLGTMSVSSAPGPTNINIEPAAVGLSTTNVDRFSALDALAETTTTPTLSHAPVSTATPTDSSYAAEGRMLGGLSQTPSGLTMMGGSTNPPSSIGISTQQSPMIHPNDMVTPGSGHVAKAYGDPGDTSSADADNPWVMGGVTGSGLQPLAPAPGAPPPPPPPEY